MLHDKIRVRIPHPMRARTSRARSEYRGQEDGKPMHVIETTAGRCIFNDILPKGMPFYNLTMAQKKLSGVISDCFTYRRQRRDDRPARQDQGPGLPARHAGGPQFRPDRSEDPGEEARDHHGNGEARRQDPEELRDGVLTERERYNQVIDAWTQRPRGRDERDDPRA